MKAKLVFTPLFFSFNSFVNSLANGKDSSVNDLDVVFTTAENTGKSSRVIFRFKVTWHSLFLTISKIFSIDFRSGFLAEIVNFQATTSSQADLVFILFFERSALCRKSFPLMIVPFLNMLEKIVHEKMRKHFQHLFYDGTVPLKPNFLSGTLVWSWNFGDDTRYGLEMVSMC